MKSTIETTLVKDENGKWHVTEKELPNWYGIEGIGFVWHGEWADPEIEYKGKRCSCYTVEDTMWQRFREECPEANEDEFDKYMWENQEDVIELTELAMQGR